ncbi:MAG: 8-hydroxy-5-deazaflavin:NADPH oxidoreductase [Solirubrobacteraceae bacterium]|nr:8-hydroxy-5-deazaflavin:NADPH oxidoreductase [Solirubrobacteraceae bacterium]
MTLQAITPTPAGSGRELGDLRLGIVGAGKFATTVARAAVVAGYDVTMSGSGPAEDIALTVAILAPGAHAGTTAAVVRHADTILLAVPTHRFREFPGDLFDGKILIDAMNHWEPVDGDDPELTTAPGGTSTIVQERFPAARVVKSLNQLGYHELDEHRRPPGSPDRVAVAAAGDDRLAVRAVMRLIDRLGFDPVDAGPLENGRLLEPDGSPFAVTHTAAELSKLVATDLGAQQSPRRSERGAGADCRPQVDTSGLRAQARRNAITARTRR